MFESQNYLSNVDKNCTIYSKAVLAIEIIGIINYMFSGSYDDLYLSVTFWDQGYRV